MRVAPSVNVELVGSRRWTTVSMVLTAAALSAVAITFCQHLAASIATTAWVVAVTTLAGGLGGRALARGDTGRLAWDGSVWRYRPAPDHPEHAGHLSVMIDLGGWMLLRFEPDTQGRAAWSRAVWLPVSDRRIATPAALRAAVYSRALNPQTASRRERDPQ